MDNLKGKELLTKYFDGTATEQERLVVEEWYAKRSMLNLSDPEAIDYEQVKAEMWAALDVKENTHQTIFRRLWPRYIGVAAAVAAIAFGVWLYTSRHPDTTSSSRTAGRDLLNDIPPGGNKATLAFNNGQTIELSEDKTGVIIGNDLKYNDGTLIAGRHPEFSSGSPTDNAIKNITATTKRGGKYEFALSDGTKVWLNNASKLDFPPIFWNPKERIVQLLTGEAYFEVAKDAKRPFIVESKGLRTEVLGTHFNISAYGDDLSIKTTLVEGSIKVNNVLIKPNQQAIITDGKLKVIEVDAANEVAWKNGDFIFKDETIENIMRKVSRWYNVEVIYAPGLNKNLVFGGYVSRSLNISAVLRLMERTGKVKFKIEGNRVYVEN